MKKITLDNGEKLSVPERDYCDTPKNPDLYFNSEYNPFDETKPKWMIPKDVSEDQALDRVAKSFKKAKIAYHEWMDLSYIHHKKRNFMKPIADHLVIKVDSEFNDKIETDIVDVNGRKVELILDTSFQKLKHAKIHGEVMAVPLNYTRDLVLTHKHLGSPAPTREWDSSEIDVYMSQIPAWNTERKKTVKRHLDGVSAGVYPEAYTPKDTKINIRRGDKAWFHYLSIDDDSFIGKDKDGLKMFKVPVRDIFCVVRNNKPIMNCGFVFVTPYYGEGYVDVEVENGHNIKGKLKWVGEGKDKVEFVTEISEKPQFLTGILEHIGNPVGDIQRPVKPGNKVMFLRNSEFINEVEGKEMYTMKQWDLIAKVRNDGLILPLGDYVLIQVQKFQPTGKIHLLEDIKWDTDEAKVIAMGSQCDELKCGDSILFNPKAVSYIKLEEDNTALIRESDIYAKR